MTAENSTTSAAQADRGRGAAGVSKAKRHKFRFQVKQHVVIVPDLGRGGVILKRSAVKFEAGTDAYLVKKDRDGSKEWYPEFSLADPSEPAAAVAPTEISLFKCAFGHFHREHNEAKECLGVPPAN